MPDCLTHIIAAEKIYDGLDEKYKEIIDKNKALYLLGAQGGDVFFFYGISYRHNPGRLLHRADAAGLFEKLVHGDPAYCAGWAAHYALDCTLHPLIYAWQKGKKGLFLHQRYERRLGTFLSRKYGIEPDILPRERIMEQTLAVCDCIKKVLPHITAAGTAACLKRYCFYMRRQLTRKRYARPPRGDFFAAAEAFERGIALGISAVERVLERDIDREIFSKSFLQK